MPLPVQSEDPIRNEERKAAVLEWATRRREVGGSVSAAYEASTSWEVTPDAEEKTILFTSDDPTTVVLPAGEDVPVGFLSLLVATGAGGVTVNGDAVTVLGLSPLMACAQNEAIYIEKVGIDTWIVVGGTA